MSEFKREIRYATIKLSKIDKEPRLRAKFLAQAIKAVGEDAFVDCVVVEKDWPIYEETWENIQRLAQGGETFGSENAALKARIAELEEELAGWAKSFEDVNARCIALSERYES